MGFLAIQKYQRLVSGTPQRAEADFHFDQVTHHHFTKKSLTPSRVNSSQQWSHPIARKVTGNFACQRNRGRAGRHFTAVTASLSLQSDVETRRTGPRGGGGGARPPLEPNGALGPPPPAVGRCRGRQKARGASAALIPFGSYRTRGHPPLSPDALAAPGTQPRLTGPGGPRHLRRAPQLPGHGYGLWRFLPAPFSSSNGHYVPPTPHPRAGPATAARTAGTLRGPAGPARTPPAPAQHLLPVCTQNGTVPSACTRCGPLKLYLYSKRRCGTAAAAAAAAAVEPPAAACPRASGRRPKASRAPARRTAAKPPRCARAAILARAAGRRHSQQGAA